nr:unnamed protein product [Hydra vulgaris]
MRTLEMSKETMSQHTQEFLDKVNVLFPIHKEGIFKLIRQDPRRSEEAVKEDSIFLKRCLKGDMVKMSYKNDKIFAEIVSEGEERMKNLLMKMMEEERLEERLRANEFSSGCSGADYDSDFEYPTAKKKKLYNSTKICLQLSLNDVLDKWIPIMTRHQVSVRAEAAMLSLLFRTGGVDIDMLNIFKSQMARKNYELIENEALIHSSLACTKLKKIQKELYSQISTPLLPIQNVPTRWNSTYLMLDRIETLKRSIQLYTANHPHLVNLILTSSEWELIENVLELLQLFFMNTDTVSKSKSMLSSVISNIRALHNFLGSLADDSRVQSMKKMIKQAIKKRFMNNVSLKGHFNVLMSKVHVLSTAVDPRYKLSLFSDEQKHLAKIWLLSEIKDQINEQKDINMNNMSELDSSSSDSFNSSPTNNGCKPSTSASNLRMTIAKHFLNCYEPEEERKNSLDDRHVSNFKQRIYSGFD